MFGLFGTRSGKNQSYPNPVTVDIHSHFLPGIDDGAATIDDSIELIIQMISMGYKKAITTPHIMSDFYKNTPEIIQNKLDEVRLVLKERNIDFQLEAAAEYYFDEWLVHQLNKKNALLTFGGRYLLFELSFMNEPTQLKEVIFHMKLSGYKPVLAHPERYIFYQDDFSKLEELADLEVLMQINISSLSGYYSAQSKKIAEMLIDKRLVSFIGSDCHSLKHIEAIKKATSSKKYEKLSDLPLLNDSLI